MKPKRRWGRLTTERRTKSPLEIKLSTEESSNFHVEDLGAESRAWKEKKQRENCFCKEGVTCHFLKTDIPV
jgi:hypothetical protein